MRIIATAALALLCAALALAACGSDDDPQPQPAPAAETTTADTRAQQQQSEPQQSPRQQTAAEQPAEQRQQQSRQQAAEQPGQEASQDDELEADASQQSRGDSEQTAEQQASQDDELDADQSTQQDSAQQQSSDELQDEEDASEQQADELESDDDSSETADAPTQSASSDELQEQEQEAETVNVNLSESAQEAASLSELELEARAAAIAASGSVNDLTGISRWLNGEATTIARELAKGNIVLIDFWTYTCVNCVRTLPFLREWHAKYGDLGLTIIGVHTPEFEFEKLTENVQDSIEQYDIGWLVAQDNDFRTWRAFNNRYWPAKYLIGPAMDVRYQHFGEGDYLETEHEIRRALLDAGWDITNIPEGTTAVAPVRDPQSRGQTRELYGGTRRNYGRVQYAAQEAYYLEAGTAQLYTDVTGSLASRLQARNHHMWYLQGLWRNEEEAIVHARATENLEDYLAFKFTSRTVNVVLTVPENGEPFNVYIEMDDRWLRPDEAGADILFDGDGRSYVRVTRNDLYRLVVLDEWSTHELKLRSNSDQLAIFAFTFGSYLGGE